MFHRLKRQLATAVLAWIALAGAAFAADVFSVASYNLHNYLDQPLGNRMAKSATAKAKVCQSICAIAPHVLAVQEIGATNALLELRASLKNRGLDYPFWEHVTGFDTNIYVAVLSKFPIVERRPHTNENFLFYGRRFRVSRGFAEVVIQVNPRYRFTLIAAHLKSKRPIGIADQADLREQEAIQLHEIIDARLRSNPGINLVILGDFNDNPNSIPIKILIGKGKSSLIDLRPIERNGDNLTSKASHLPPHNIAWTYHYATEDTYSRFDYILISRGMAREWNPDGTYILTLPNWGIGSDHRPIVASFVAVDK